MESRDGCSEMYELLCEFLQPSNDIIRNDDLCNIIVDFLEFGVNMSSAQEVTRHDLGYVVDAETANAEELRECLHGCLLGGHLELLDVYWRHASQGLKNRMLFFVWGNMQVLDEKTAACLIEHLLSHGADANFKFNCKCTFLHHACGHSGSAMIVKVLLSNGADVNARNITQVCCFFVFFVFQF